MLEDFCDASFDDELNRLNLHLSSHNVHMNKVFHLYGLAVCEQLTCRNVQRKHHIGHKHTVVRTYVSNEYDLLAVVE